jgi:predicted Zn-dependent protease
LKRQDLAAYYESNQRSNEKFSVVAHEIAHVVARDGMRAQTITPDIESSTEVTRLPDGVTGVGQVNGYLIPLNNVGERRETEADYNDIRYLQKSGYSPRALITFLEKMLLKEQIDPKSVLRMFQTHPPTRQRIQRIGERIGFPTEMPVTDAELQKIKEIIDHSPRQQVPSTSH